GWQLVDPCVAAGDPHAFRGYVQGSWAEFSVAQGVYVETESGWFSDRTVRYLASGKPALVQDTGFSRLYPVGEGLLAFCTLDLADCRRIAGWAWARAQPAAPIQVEILDGETRLGTVTADMHRDDLAKNGKGNGNHGFSLVVPPSLKDGQPHAISARVADGG